MSTKPIRCLSLIQPWASLMSLRVKRIETRNWRTSYTGLVAIHASKSYPKWAKEYARTDEECSTELFLGGFKNTDDVPLGCILAVGALTGCRPTEVLKDAVSEQERGFGDYSPLRWGWMFERMLILPEPKPARGALGLWKPDPELAEWLVSTYEASPMGSR